MGLALMDLDQKVLDLQVGTRGRGRCYVLLAAALTQLRERLQAASLTLHAS